MTSAKVRGRKIAAETRALAASMEQERVRYWAALLGRPQLARPIVYAVQNGNLDAAGWSRRLACLVGYGQAMVETRRAWERDRYLGAVARAAVWLADIDRRCGAANACHRGISLWAARQLQGGCLWSSRKFPKGRERSQTWRTYWGEVERAKRERERLRNRIVVLNEGLVISAANKWIPWATGHLTEDDIMQGAREGMMTAADRYDTSKAAFSTYSMWWMRAIVFRLHQNQRGDVRAPTAVQGLALQLGDLVDLHPEEAPAQIRERWDLHLEAEHLKAVEKAEANGSEPPKRRPTPTVDAVKRAMEYLGHHQVSLEQPVSEGYTLADVLACQQTPADEQLDDNRVLARLTEALEQLPAADRAVVSGLYGLDQQAKTARELARSGMGTVLEIETKQREALDRLRERMTG